MIQYEDCCVGCPPWMGCREPVCPNKNVPRLYCDKCDTEADELFKIDGEEFCLDCLCNELYIERVTL